MEILDKKLKLGMLNQGSANALNVTTFIKRVGCLFLAAVSFFANSGCRKLSDEDIQNKGSYYGYGKLVVTCGGECNVSFGEVGKMNVYTISSTTATYSFRYQTKYQLGISITPTDKDQSIKMDVYSREEKQIFHNTVNQKVNVPWQSQILVP